jgi:phosphoglycerate dehydrogenase-like enzyme
MKGTILITDTLFIFKEHEDKLRSAGYEIERLDKPEATEAELIAHIKGKVGYILGGIEKVTDKVIDAADSLKAIAFTGADARGFIPAFDKATARGVAISTTPAANSYAVAEYTLAVMLAMTRNLFELGRTGETKFETAHSLNELAVGIIGMGNIGTRVATMLHCLGVKKLLYTNRTRKTDVEEKTGAEFVTMDELLRTSNIVSLHVSKEVGDGFIGKEELAKLQDGALLINCGFMGCIDRKALLPELMSGRLRAAEDGPADPAFSTLPLSVWYCSNAHTAYNTFEANKKASDMATESILNLLTAGRDQYRVN